MPGRHRPALIETAGYRETMSCNACLILGSSERDNWFIALRRTDKFS